MPAVDMRWNTSAGSMSPDRVPMTRPSSGVRPIEVSTLRPPRTAQADAPLPRCSVTRSTESTGLPRTSAAFAVTYWCDVPWKPYRRILCALATVWSIA